MEARCEWLQWTLGGLTEYKSVALCYEMLCVPRKKTLFTTVLSELQCSFITQTEKAIFEET